MFDFGCLICGLLCVRLGLWCLVVCFNVVCLFVLIACVALGVCFVKMTLIDNDFWWLRWVLACVRFCGLFCFLI